MGVSALVNEMDASEFKCRDPQEEAEYQYQEEDVKAGDNPAEFDE